MIQVTLIVRINKSRETIVNKYWTGGRTNWASLKLGEIIKELRLDMPYTDRCYKRY